MGRVCSGLYRECVGALEKKGMYLTRMIENFFSRPVSLGRVGIRLDYTHDFHEVKLLSPAWSTYSKTWTLGYAFLAS